MAHITDRIPKMADQDLLTLFGNAIKQIAEGKKLAEATSVIATIGGEWKRRLDAARAGTYKPDRPVTGMLATLGYHVGAERGERTPVRRTILKHMMEGQLPLVDSPAYTDEWGEPRSPERYSKLTQVLELQRSNPAHSEHAQAIIAWVEDLDWVQNNYAHLLRLESAVAPDQTVSAA